MTTTPNSSDDKRTARRLNYFLLRLSRNWLRVALVIIGIYASLPFIAPTLMRLGMTGPGRVLYTLYSPFCHQFAFRSFFLYGEQPVYPRANTGTDLRPFEAYASESPEFQEIFERYTGQPNLGSEALDVFSPALQFASREFVGDERMGYKMTLCERDIAIYIALFVGGLIYSHPMVRRRLRPLPIWLYIFLGLGPIGLDGFSQLLGYPPFNLWSPRETLPIFRVLTGALFGLMNAWLAFPYLDMSMQETRRELEAKFARAGIRV